MRVETAAAGAGDDVGRGVAGRDEVAACEGVRRTDADGAGAATGGAECRLEAAVSGAAGQR
jgi:hypothetical protein